MRMEPRRTMAGRGRAVLVAVALAVGVVVPSAVAATGPAPAVIGSVADGAPTYADVPLTHKFHEAISWLGDQGVTKGYADGKYRPLESITRGQMAAFLFRYADDPAYRPPSRAKYRDVPVSHKFYTAISWLAAEGITSGYPDGTFKPTRAVTRGQMAAFLYRFAGRPAFTPPAKATFRDVRVGSSFYKAVEWLARTGITAGYNDGQYGVAKPVTRGAMAAFLYRFDDWLAPLPRLTTVETATAASGSALYGHRPSISADGRWLVYHDQGWTPGKPTIDNVLVKNRTSGGVELVSRTAGGDGGNASSWGTIGAGGDDIVVTSLASDLDLDPAFGDDNDDWDVFVAGRTGGTIELASRTSGDVAGGGDSFGGDVSDDGRWVVFWSEADDLVADDAPGSPDVFLLDRDTGDLTLVSSAAAGDPVNGSSHLPVISGDGRWIAYCTNARELSPGLPIGAEALVVTDRVSGSTTMVAPLSDGEEETEDCESLDISADGRWIAFTSWRRGLAPGDTDDSQGVFVADRSTGAIKRVSTATYRTPQNGYANGASISSDGRWIVYESLASNLVPRDTNGRSDVFVTDRITGVTARVSAAANGTGGNGASLDAKISGNGRWVVYFSWASNLAAGDTNGPGDVFVTSNPLLPGD